MVKIIDIKFQGIKSAIACFLIDSGEGLIMIETGPSNVYNNIKINLEKEGYNIKEIKHVFVTHIHLDHSGGAWRFAENGAKIYVHPQGADHLIDPQKLIKSATKIYGDKMDTLWGEIKGINKNNIKKIENKEKIKIGNTTIKSIHTPGHANHHIAWKINNSIFTGDVAGAKIKDGPVLPACPPPEVDLEKWHKSLNLIIEEKSAYEIDMQAIRMTPGVTGYLVTITTAQENNWIKEKKSKYDNIEDLTEAFNKYVYNFLKNKAQLDEKLIDQYYAANPPYMSVAGLVRYWDKIN